MTTLASTLVVHIREASDLVVGDCLLGGSVQLTDIPGVMVSTGILAHTIRMHVGDVILRGQGDAATIVACASEADSLFLFVAPLALVEHVTEHASRFRLEPGPGLKVRRALDVSQCLAWSGDPDGSLIALRM